MKILVLEDDPLQAADMAYVLQSAGHDVTTALDNGSATTALASGGFQLVVADLMIGKETSIPTLDCARCFCPQAEIILVTGTGLFPHGELHYAYGGVSFRLQKPVRAEDLAALAAHCECPKGQGPSPESA